MNLKSSRKCFPKLEYFEGLKHSFQHLMFVPRFGTCILRLGPLVLRLPKVVLDYLEVVMVS